MAFGCDRVVNLHTKPAWILTWREHNGLRNGHYIDKLNLANLEGKVMDKIMEYLVATLRQLRILPGINMSLIGSYQPISGLIRT